jgi:spermidine synthase
MDRVRRPVLVYAVLELGIGLTALAVPQAISAARFLNVAILGGSELPVEGAFGSGLIYGVSSFVILLVPTALMGATLPLLARYAVQRDSEIGSRVGLLYTVNTVGAAAGTLLTAFVLLPRIGLGQTILVAVAINVIVFGLAALLARGFRPLKTDPHGLPIEAVAGSTAETSGRPGEKAATFDWILPLILVSGVVSFSWEILWTRLLSNLFGSSVYAFATMLATFLMSNST